MPKHGIHKIEEYKHLGKADLHIHSDYSDGRPSVQEILDYVQDKTDLDVIAITDHDTIEGAKIAQQLIKQKRYRFAVIVGEEITSKEGHILGLFLTEKIEPGLEVGTTIKKIHEQGGVAVASHPFMHTRWRNPNMNIMDGIGLISLMKEKDEIDGIEVVNATPTLGEENLSADFINKTVLLRAETGSSDAHIVEAIGKGYTLFEGKTAHDLKEAILSAQTQGMHNKWTFFALFKYLFFFIPKGFRMALYTLFYGRTKKRPKIVNVPKRK